MCCREQVCGRVRWAEGGATLHGPAPQQRPWSVPRGALEPQGRVALQARPGLCTQALTVTEGGLYPEEA